MQYSHNGTVSRQALTGLLLCQFRRCAMPCCFLLAQRTLISRFSNTCLSHCSSDDLT